jgi:hypothetical protein
MARIKLLFLTLLLLPVTTIAGNTGHHAGKNIQFRPVYTNYSVGFAGGLNYSNVIFKDKYFISDSYLLETDYNFMYSFGLTGHYRNQGSSWSYQVELNLDQRGMSYNDIIYTWWAPQSRQLQSKINNDLKLTYYNIPILAQYHFGRVVMMYAEAGPYIGFLRNARESGIISYESPNIFGSIITQKADFEFNKTTAYGTDVGLIVGFGMIVPLVDGIRGPSTSLILNLRYNYGLKNVYVGEEAKEQNPVEEIIGLTPDIPDPSLFENNIRTSAFAIRFGLLFAI